MPPPIGNADCSDVLETIDTLHKKWERKIPYLAEQGRGPWASSVLFAIEIARNRIAEECAGSPTELNRLLDEWEQLSSRVDGGTVGESLTGIDFGISLVVRRVRRYVNRLPQRKPPTSANGNQAPLDHKRLLILAPAIPPRRPVLSLRVLLRRIAEFFG